MKNKTDIKESWDKVVTFHDLKALIQKEPTLPFENDGNIWYIVVFDPYEEGEVEYGNKELGGGKHDFIYELLKENYV